MKTLLIILLSVALVCSAFSQSKPLVISQVVTDLSAYQVTTAKGATNGYAPLGSNNALVPGQYLFPGFTNAADGTLGVKSGSSFAATPGLQFSTNSLISSAIKIGNIQNDSLVLYGIAIPQADYSYPLVLMAGSQNKVYVANGQTFGGANNLYNGFNWSISTLGAFSLGSGTLSGSLSLSSNSITLVKNISFTNGLSINLSNNTISSMGSSVDITVNGTGTHLIVPNAETNGLFSLSSPVATLYASYALNAASADHLYPRTAGANTWPLVQTFSAGVTLGSPLAVSGGGSGASNAPSARANLGVAIGTNVQAYNGYLSQIAALTPSNNYVIVGNGSAWVANSPAQAQASLGVSIGTNVQAYSSILQFLSTQGTPSANSLLIGNGTNWVTTTPAASRASLGLAIGTNVQAYSANLDAYSTNTNLLALSTNTNIVALSTNTNVISRSSITGATTNVSFISISSTNSTNQVTNSIVISNGLITSWTKSGN